MTNKKTQMEITNVMFMHLVGFIGIMAFTFLFISLMTGSESRASGLKEESIYQNYARRLISSSDCLAYNYIESYYDSYTSNVYYYSNINPGVIDMGKFFDFNHQNCLRYDLVSGAISNDPKKKEQVFPVVLYEVKVYDLDQSINFEFSNAVFQSKGLAIDIDICRPKQGAYPGGCLLDCDELREYLNLINSTDFNESSKEEQEILLDKYYYGTSLDGVNESNNMPTYPHPGVNCWEESFRDSLRAVIPYKGLKCSTIKKDSSFEYGFGNVLETSSQYFVKLRYELSDNTVQTNDGMIEMKFCVINIPTMCDPAFRETSQTSAFNNFMSTLGIDIETDKIYQNDTCVELGLPLI